MGAFHVVVIGAGSTGAAIAHDLALRGLAVTVVERAGIASGTTGHNQAQLHSGARYAVRDPESARECIQENLLLRRLMPEALELNDGLFIALNDEHLAYREPFLEGCAACGIPARELPAGEALALEPGLNPALRLAIQIPDGVFDSYRFTLSFAASARRNGAIFRTFTEVTGLEFPAGRVRVRERATGREEILGCDAVVNAAGPWAPQVAALAGVPLEVEASAGVMVTLRVRLCNMVVNLLAPPADADIIVPQRQTSILGTTSWAVADPDNIPIPADHIRSILDRSEWMIPGSRNAPVLGAMAAARPLIRQPGAGGREVTRGFQVLDHAAAGAPGFFSVVGGKTTTARLMAEKLSDLVCARLGVGAACRTRTEPLASFRLGV
jgi:glycerol-3-phosphate dehydrogenase